MEARDRGLADADKVKFVGLFRGGLENLEKTSPGGDVLDSHPDIRAAEQVREQRLLAILVEFRSDEHSAFVNDRRTRPPFRQLRSPSNVFSLTPLSGQLSVVRNAVRIRPSPTRPVSARWQIRSSRSKRSPHQPRRIVASGLREFEKNAGTSHPLLQTWLSLE